MTAQQNRKAEVDISNLGFSVLSNKYVYDPDDSTGKFCSFQSAKMAWLMSL